MRYLLFLIMTSTMVGCSTFMGRETTVPVADQQDSVTLSIPTCQRTQRDLSVPWNQRFYHCASAQFAKEEEEYLEYRKTDSRRIRVRRMPDLDQVISAPDSIEDRTVNRDTIISDVPRDISAFAKVIGESHPSEPGQSTSLTITYRIPFAKNIEVLGPIGKEKIERLLSAAKNAKSVFLKGAAMKGEGDTDAEKDKLAVGRSLSVRKALSELAGIPVENIKILYRDDSESGRYVEIKFDA